MYNTPKKNKNPLLFGVYDVYNANLQFTNLIA